MRQEARTKYVILVGDGMADYPLEAFGGKTCLEAAATPNMDRVAACGLGRVRTVPEGMESGSDIANLSLMGYDPLRYHTGRSPLEAAGMGVELLDGDVAFRMNLVTLERRSEDEIVIISHNAGDITTQEARVLVEALRRELESPLIKLHTGVAFRHLLTWKGGTLSSPTVPPHDVLDRNVASYMHTADHDPVAALIRRSWDVLSAHPVNHARKAAGKIPATSIWLWGQGRPPVMPSFESFYGLTGGVISAVDLIKGIGIYAGLRPVPVEGATGLLDTNYEGKVREAIRGLDDEDLMFLHVEAPDEAGHSGDPDMKIRAIEYFDARIVGPVLQGLEEMGRDFRVLVVSDHFTPISRRTHTPEPPPFAWATRQDLARQLPPRPFSESESLKNGLLLDPGYEIMRMFTRIGDSLTGT
jgi:2,3-bisphosphoglycerate-independent phosphoglycerate mutase